jgi:AcrR family transcriptional regulator
LVAAAKVVFAEVGYAGTTVKMLVEAAGVSTATLYHHFGGKAGLYCAAADAIADEVIAQLAPAVRPDEPFLHRLDAVVEGGVGVLDMHPAAGRFLLGIRQAIDHDPAVAEAGSALRRIEEFLASIAGNVDLGVSPQDTARLLEVLMYGFMQLTAAEDGHERFAAAARALRAILSAR